MTYEKPEMDIITFNEDVITTSTLIDTEIGGGLDDDSLDF